MEYFIDFFMWYKVYFGMSLCLDVGGGILFDYCLGISEVGCVFGECELCIFDLLWLYFINVYW